MSSYLHCYFAGPNVGAIGSILNTGDLALASDSEEQYSVNNLLLFSYKHGLFIRAVRRRRRAAAADILMTPPPTIVTDRPAAADRMSASRRRRFRNVFMSCCTSYNVARFL